MWSPMHYQPAVLQIGNCSKNSLLLVLKRSNPLLKGAAGRLGPSRGPARPGKQVAPHSDSLGCSHGLPQPAAWAAPHTSALVA